MLWEVGPGGRKPPGMSVSQEPLSRSLRETISTASLALALLGCGQEASDPAAPEAEAAHEESASTELPDAAFEEPQTAEEVLRQIQWSEDVIGLIRPATARLKESVLNLKLPGALARQHFTEEVEVLDLDKRSKAESPHGALANVRAEEVWSLALTKTTQSREDLSIWPALFADVEYFDYASFKVVRGRFDAHRSYTTDVLFSTKAHKHSGELTYVSGHLELHWVYGPKGQRKKTWRIDRWTTLDMHETSIERTLFEEVLDRALPSGVARKNARRSIHQEKIVEYFLNTDLEKPPGFQAAAWDRHPGLSVVDVNEDGLDDLYVMDRWGKNQLLVNRGDGTFSEEGARYGLDIEDHSSSALFADLDNDGDRDLVLGRTLGRSQYLRNEEGTFVDRSKLVDAPLPYLVSSVSASDVDRDGVLDVYLSTYAAATIQEELEVSTASPITRSVADKAKTLLSGFLTPEQSRHMGEFFASDANLIRNRPGPPNALLQNRGKGRLHLAGDEHPLTVWKNTYQTTFFDIDLDGDADAYVANDFAPNVMFRSDGRGGFVDVTGPTDTADIGFGMGAAAGDYDRDGDFDLYVSNMFTKAGRRITAMAPTLDERFVMMTRGNSLFRNDGESFERVSGLESPHVLVENAGWSWGGQFFDFNNDAYLDIYAPSGYYSSPKEIGIPVDT